MYSYLILAPKGLFNAKTTCEKILCSEKFDKEDYRFGNNKVRINAKTNGHQTANQLETGEE